MNKNYNTIFLANRYIQFNELKGLTHREKKGLIKIFFCFLAYIKNWFLK